MLEKKAWNSKELFFEFWVRTNKLNEWIKPTFCCWLPNLDRKHDQPLLNVYAGAICSKKVNSEIALSLKVDYEKDNCR